jgi:hypothetical protein
MDINIPTFSIARRSKIYPNWDFLFENKPSGIPGVTEFDKLFSSITSTEFLNHHHRITIS